jgi:hypothetical protein
MSTRAALRFRRQVAAAALLCAGAATIVPAAREASSAAGSAAFTSAAAPATLVDRAREVLDVALRHEEGWVWIHALEVAVDLGEQEKVRRLLLPRLRELEQSAIRVGVWRVLAGIASDAEEQASWRVKIEATFLDARARDRLQAIESLAKLGQVRSPRVIEAARSLRSELPESDAIFPLWALVVAGDAGALTQLVGSLQSPDPILRRRAAYVLRWVRPAAEWVKRSLVRALDEEPPGTLPHAYLLCAALSLDLDSARTAGWAPMLEHVLPQASPGLTLEACQALRLVQGPAEIVRLAPLLDHAHGDVRIGAAWALLHVLERR